MISVDAFVWALALSLFLIGSISCKKGTTWINKNCEMKFHNSYWKVLPQSVDTFMTKATNSTCSSLGMKIHNSIFYVNFPSPINTQHICRPKCLIHLKCSSSAFILQVDCQSHLVLGRSARPQPLTQSGCKAGSRHLALAAGGDLYFPRHCATLVTFRRADLHR